MTKPSRTWRFGRRKTDVPALPPNPDHRAITVEEATRALYVDFESTMDAPPVLVGYQAEGDFRQVVLDERLAEPASHSGLPLMGLADGLKQVLQVCAEESRLLVAYSQHERLVFHEHLGIDVSDIYRDARMIAVRWKNRARLQLPSDDHELKTFLEAIGYPRRSYLGQHRSAKWVREVIEMVKRKGSFAALTPTKKRAWTKLLEHNRVDCDGMRELVLRAAASARAVRRG